ncbi:hypothetical protein Tco_0169672 [Tanacetum coccineum]
MDSTKGLHVPDYRLPLSMNLSHISGIVFLIKKKWTSAISWILLRIKERSEKSLPSADNLVVQKLGTSLYSQFRHEGVSISLPKYLQSGCEVFWCCAQKVGSRRCLVVEVRANSTLSNGIAWDVGKSDFIRTECSMVTSFSGALTCMVLEGV